MDNNMSHDVRELLRDNGWSVSKDEHVQDFANAIELAIVHRLLSPGGCVELENLGTFQNDDGNIVFRPSAFLESAAQVIRKKL